MHCVDYVGYLARAKSAVKGFAGDGSLRHPFGSVGVVGGCIAIRQ